VQLASVSPQTIEQNHNAYRDRKRTGNLVKMTMHRRIKTETKNVKSMTFAREQTVLCAVEEHGLILDDLKQEMMLGFYKPKATMKMSAMTMKMSAMKMTMATKTTMTATMPSAEKTTMTMTPMMKTTKTMKMIVKMTMTVEAMTELRINVSGSVIVDPHAVTRMMTKKAYRQKLLMPL
jgi:hypothetical protein